MNTEPFEDLRWVLTRGQERGGHLLRPDENEIVETIRGLPDPSGVLYARLWNRSLDVYSLSGLLRDWSDDAEVHLRQLIERKLLSNDVTDERILAHMSSKQLGEQCRAHRLKTSGNKETLRNRLSDKVLIAPGEWLLMSHRTLLSWMTQWAFMRIWPRKEQLVLDRLGHRRWPSYDLTSGTPIAANRDSWQRWCNQLDRILDPDTSLSVLLDDLEEPLGEGRFSLEDILHRVLVSRAKEVEPQRRLDILRTLYPYLKRDRGGTLFRMTRIMEQTGDSEEAYGLLSRERGRLDERERFELQPIGRRLGRVTGRGWAPERALRRARVRELQLPKGRTDGRRLEYQVADHSMTVESAVIAFLANLQRRSLRAEGGFLRTLYGLLFSSAYFLKRKGMLPVPYLRGPLDVGRSGFYLHRKTEMDCILHQIGQGGAVELVNNSFEQFEGLQLAGVHWSLMARSDWEKWTVRQQPEALQKLAQYLVQMGFSATSGFPDLVLMAGEPKVLKDAFPSRLTDRGCFVEVKGPRDTMSSAQELWADRLLGWGFEVEQWDITIRPNR